MSKWPFDHYKRWNIDYSTDESFEQFKYRMSNYLNGIFLSKSEADDYNFLIGSRIAVSKNQYGHYGDVWLSDILILKVGFTEYINRLQTLFELYTRLEKEAEKEFLCGAVETCLRYSPDIGISLHKGQETVTLYPKGAELLDEGIINKTLSWLETHPEVLKHFDVALKLYMENDDAKQRSLRNELRFSMEQLLREILQNNKPIEKQNDDLKSWLKAKDAHPQVVNLYRQLLFNGYNTYQNDVKHAGTYKEQDTEFMIYLTATFMRQLLELERTE
jgi:hypothetical protein